jgi:uncharacterized protein (DUF1330 family)
MAAYLFANVDIKNPEEFKKYMAATPSIIKKFGGRFLVRGSEFEICEGEWNPKRLVMVEFESMEKARAFYNSDGYKAIRQIRQNSAYTEWIFMEGISDEVDKVLNK